MHVFTYERVTCINFIAHKSPETVGDEVSEGDEGGR